MLMNIPHHTSHMISAIALLFIIILVSCSNGSEEGKAQLMLQEARTALRNRQYADARDTIMSLRKKHPTAIEARKQGILLLDSIEMNAAADSLRNAEGTEWERLSVKRKFYERKLQEDLKRATQDR